MNWVQQPAWWTSGFRNLGLYGSLVLREKWNRTLLLHLAYNLSEAVGVTEQLERLHTEHGDELDRLVCGLLILGPKR